MLEQKVLLSLVYVQPHPPTAETVRSMLLVTRMDAAEHAIPTFTTKFSSSSFSSFLSRNLIIRRGTSSG